MTSLPAPPPLHPMTHIECDVGAVQTLGPAPFGERRFVPLAGGSVAGPELDGRIVEGGVDWQWVRSDGVIEIAAHYAVRTGDGALIEVRSDGYRHGSPEVLARLARGEAVGRDEMYFRTVVRFATGAPAWSHLNGVLALCCGARQARLVVLDLYRIG